MNTPQNHPAETGAGVAAAVAVLISYVFHIHDANVIAALVILVGAVPASITWLVLLIRRRNGQADPGAGT